MLDIVVIGFEMIIFFGKLGIDVILFENDNCFVKKVIILVNSILINSVLFIFKDIRIIVILSLVNVSSIGVEWRLLSLIKFVLFFVMIFVKCKLIKVINSLILVVIVCFKFLGIVFINFVWKDVNDSKIKIIFVMNIVENVIVKVMFLCVFIIE